MIDKKELSERIDDIVGSGVFGKEFKFRVGQKDIIIELSNAYFSKSTENYLLGAPTGSGKSVIAITCSKLIESFDSKGYLLTSDKALQKQYEADFKRMNLKFGNVMGVDNYTCFVNNLKYSLGECRMRNLSGEQVKSLHCYPTCGYLQARDKAIKSNVSLLNYSYWLLVRNYVAKKQEESMQEITFAKRDFIFFDECHKIPSIVQSHFSPLIDYKIVERMENLHSLLKDNDFKVSSFKKATVYDIISKLIISNDKKEQYKLLEEFDHFLSQYAGLIDTVKAKIKRIFDIDETPTSEWKKMTSYLEFFNDLHCKIEDYIEIIGNVGVSKLIKTPNNEDSVNYKCLDDRHLVKKYLLDQAGFKVFMSATIGNPKTFMMNTSIKDAKLLDLPNQFSYDKSPIFIFKKWKMSYKDKEKSLPKLIKIVDSILDKYHSDERGIIHSGSYDITKKLLDLSSNKHRMINYTNTDEKREALLKFDHKKNGILIGPSIIEGLDFKDDLSRFQIFFKVPYPSLGDPFIKAKLEESQEWYNYITSLQILQGIGRSVRSENDWAKTYLIDGCFFDFYNQNKKDFPNWFHSRVQILNF